MLFNSKKIASLGFILIAVTGLNCANIAEAKPLFSPSQIEISQENQGEIIVDQMTQYMMNAFAEIPPFVQGLTQLENTQTDQELYFMLQQLAPMAARITGNFAQAENLGQQINAMLPVNSEEASIMNQMLTLSGQGSMTFAGWVDILMPMLEALSNQNMAQFQAASGQFPKGINQTMAFMNTVQTFVQTYDHNTPNSAYTNSPSTPNQNSLDGINNLSNISSQMDNINRGIINNMGANGEWRYNPATGQNQWVNY